MNMKKSFLAIIAITVVCWSVCAQEKDVTLRDTLPAAVKISHYHLSRETGNRIIKLSEINTMVSATGEADAIKYIQTLPGIAIGAEGSSAFYVRGGNLGSNIITLDGVPVYGSSHLLGFSSAFSQEIISDTYFQVGGFTSEEGNLTASHISLTTKDGNSDEFRYKVSASNFLLGGVADGPIVKNRLSMIGSFRISPIACEYRAAQMAFPNYLDSLNRVSAAVYDLYCKVKYIKDARNKLSLSIFNTLDSYRYDYKKTSDERMRWGNLLVNFQWDAIGGKPWDVRRNISYNRFSSHQGSSKIMNGSNNNLDIVSSIDEVTLQGLAYRNTGKHGRFQVGLKSRTAVFNPGSSSKFAGSPFLVGRESSLSDNKSVSLTNTFHFQRDLLNEKKYHFRLSARINSNTIWKERARAFTTLNPEMSLLAKVMFAKWLGIECTADWLAQYYHTLEGVPLGWSLDMSIPSDDKFVPEKAAQYYGGLFSTFGKHHLSVGFYQKEMKNLLYYKDAKTLFSSALAQWKDNIEIGSGTSHGVEVLYEKEGDVVNYKIAYTWSKTDRTFPAINSSRPFPAKFDRRHILNVTAFWKIAHNVKRDVSAYTLFTLQSGNMETVSSGKYVGTLLLDGGEVTMDYYSAVNNFRMPMYERWDIGCDIRFKSGKHPQDLKLGLFNVLNRHNIYTITYNPDKKKWQSISLLPIMPSFSYTIEF